MSPERPGFGRVSRIAAFAVAAVLVIDIGAAIGWNGKRAGGANASSGTIPVNTTRPSASSTETTTRPGAPSTTRPVLQAGSSPTTTPVAQASTTVSTSTTIPSGPQTLPPAGDYTYDTSGYERISIANPRSFPSTSVVVVAPAGCGESETWKPSASHRQSIQLCPAPGGLRIVDDDTTIVFDGERSTTDLACSANSFLPITTGVPGQQWNFVCSDSTTTAAEDVTLIGTESLTVAGDLVNAVHVEVDMTLSGGQNGTGVTDFWFTDGAVLVQETSSLSVATETAIGEVTYTSSYTLQLASLQPGG